MTAPSTDFTKGEALFTDKNHPLMQAQMWGMPALYDWQQEIVGHVAVAGSRSVVSTGNGMGKTRVLVPLVGLSVMAAFPGATVVSTAGAESQITGQLFKYLGGIMRPYRDAGWGMSISSLTAWGPKRNGLQSKWVARVPKDPLTVEGYHGSWEQDDKKIWRWCPVCVIIDEAKSVDERVFEAAWRIDPDFLFVVSTPGEPDGPFYDAMDPDTMSGGVGDDENRLWKYRRKVCRRDCPHLLTPEKTKLYDRICEKFGARSSFVQSTYNGEFQRDSDENQVFSDSDLARVKASMKVKSSYTPGKKCAGLEFSSGGDEQPIMIMDGNKQVFSKPYREEDTDKLARCFLADLQKFGLVARECVGDNGGVGKAIIDSMEAKGFRGIERYMNNHTAISKHEYADRMTEDHWRFKEMLRLHPEIQLIDDPVLMKQMRQRRYRQDEYNRAKLEEKPKHRVRCGESPDRLDTFIMMMSRWAPVAGPKPPPGPDDYVSPLENEARVKSGRGGGVMSGMCRSQVSMFGPRRGG